MSVIWHDLECGGYDADFPLWRSLAAREGNPILDIGAGTGRVAIDLARHGHRVTAVELDDQLAAELGRRVEGLEVEVVHGDARALELDREFALCLVPMQTIQLLGGSTGRAAFLLRARRHLRAGGMLAIAIAEQLELYDGPAGGPEPLPDICERDGVVYSSRPTAIRAQRGGYLLERHRETVGLDGRHAVQRHTITLEPVTASALERESRAAGLKPAGRATIAATRDYAGSEVVIVRA